MFAPLDLHSDIESVGERERESGREKERESVCERVKERVWARESVCGGGQRESERER